MTKIFLFGSRDIYSIPKNIEDQLYNLLQQTNGQLEFLVGDAGGVDAAFQKTLSAIGARSKTKIYCMDSARNNKFDLPVRIFKSEYDPDTKRVTLRNEETGDETVFENIEKPEDLKFNRDYYTFKDRQMINDCDMAVALWDTKSKGTFTNINILKAQDKPVYVFTVVR